MRKIAILAASIMVIAVMLAVASTALAAVPHGSYGTGNATGTNQTDLCLTCHDVHNAAGDYVLMRESTVTAVCGTCHVVYGDATGAVPSWTEPPCTRATGDTSSGCTTDLNTRSPEAGVSPSAAYKNLTPISGHRLGMGTDAIPASSSTLKVIRSADYEEGEIYDHNLASSLGATNGLYCASCHTPHGSLTGRDTDGDTYADIATPSATWNTSGTAITSEFFSGDQLVDDDSPGGVQPLHRHAAYPQWLLSSNPNHNSPRSAAVEVYTDSNSNGKYDVGEPFTDNIIPNGLRDSMMAPTNPVKGRDEFCLRCHDKQWNGTEFEGHALGEGTGGNNHPPLCMSCHGPAMATNTGTNDFPHTSTNYKIVSKDHDGLCLGCHSNGRLP